MDDQFALDMEDHLLQCPICLEIFLELISQEDLLQAEQCLSSDFTRETMHLVNDTRRTMSHPIRSHHKGSRKKLFGYYVAAAVLTLTLTSGGVFESLIDQSTNVTALCTRNSLEISEGFHMKIPQTIQQSEQWLQSLTNITRGGMRNEFKK